MTCSLHAFLVCCAAPSALNYDAHPYPGLTASRIPHLRLRVTDQPSKRQPNDFPHVDLDLDLDVDVDLARLS